MKARWWVPLSTLTTAEVRIDHESPLLTAKSKETNIILIKINSPVCNFCRTLKRKIDLTECVIILQCKITWGLFSGSWIEEKVGWGNYNSHSILIF